MAEFDDVSAAIFLDRCLIANVLSILARILSVAETLICPVLCSERGF